MTAAPPPAEAADRSVDTARTAAALLASVAVGLWLLARPIAAFGDRLWGPERPWVHRDFLGAWYLFWAAGHDGDELAMQSWPDGALPVQHHVPNPFDAWLVGPLVADAPFPLWWNLMQLGHHLGNVAAAAWLVRAMGGRASSAAVAGALVAASPVMLHEIAGGRTLSGAVWPGLLALGLLVRGRSVAAGLLIGVQGLFYVYTGLLVGLVALILRPAWGLLAAAVPMGPYLWWLSPVWSDAQGRPPDAGFSELPLAGLLGLSEVQERFRLHPALILGLPALFAARGRRPLRLAAAIALAALVALGPEPTWSGPELLFTSPLAWAGAAFEPLARMHHPIRATLVLVPLLAVGLSRLLDRLPWQLALAGLLLALPMRHDVMLGAAWSVLPEPEGLEQARWLAEHDVGAVVDLTGNHGGALALQPTHGRPTLEGLRKELPEKARQVGWLRQGVDPWLEGERVSPVTLRALREAGFTHVLVVPRGSEVPAAGVEADLGLPVFRGIYAL